MFTMDGEEIEVITLKEKLNALADNDVNLLERKGEEYGDSWKKRGGVGAYMMLARKWDRIENSAKGYNYDIFEAVDKDYGLIDDIVDLGCYLWLVRTEKMLVEKDPWSEMSKRPRESTGSGNPYVIADQEAEKVSDAALLDYYDVTMQEDATEEEIVRLKSALHDYHYRDNNVHLSAIMAGSRCVKSYVHPTTDHTVVFPDRSRLHPNACDEDCGPRLYEPHQPHPSR